MELAGLGSIPTLRFVGLYVKRSIYTTYAIYLLSAPVFFLLVSGSFEPLAPEPEVVHQLAKGAKEKSQTQGDQEHGEREDDKRRDAAAFISLNRGPCCTTQKYYAYCYFYQSHSVC